MARTKFTRAEVLADLVDMNIVAARFGVSLRSVQQWRYRSDEGRIRPPTPAPVMTAGGNVPLFWWDEWAAWGEATGRAIPEPDAIPGNYVQAVPA